MTPDREIDEDARRDEIDARRRFIQQTRCRCGGDMPGTCPGPAFCPNCDDEPEDAA